MSDKKHIDRLFQEGLKDFEAKPSDAVWKNIEAKLNQKKKKRRVVPIWWRYAGVAALLAILLTVGSVYFNNTSTNQVVDTKDNYPSKLKNNPSNDSNNLIKNENTVTDNNALNDDLNTNKNIVSDNNSENSKQEKASQNNAEILTDNINISKDASITKTTPPKNINGSSVNSQMESNSKSNVSNSTLKMKDETVIASNSEEKNDETIQNKNDESLIDFNKAEKTINNAFKNNTVVAETNEKTETPVNTKTTQNTLSIEEALDKAKDIAENDTKLNRWSVAPNAAPVYFNSLGDGSSIDPQFNSNSKTGEVNMSYGISASYAVNKKVSIRSGVNRVNLGYNTNNVVLYRSVGFSSSSSSLRNVSSGNSNNSSSDNISVISGEDLSTSSPELLAASNTSINQSLGYIEVPLEIQYALSSKKLGINVIGGFSSFFLNNNKIYSEAADNGSKIFLGEATNINKVSYSANLGLGLNYKMSEKIDLNLEPMFKYQINTFNNTSGDFKPYFIGVYTGFAIKF